MRVGEEIFAGGKAVNVEPETTKPEAKNNKKTDLSKLPGVICGESPTLSVALFFAFLSKYFFAN